MGFTERALCSVAFCVALGGISLPAVAQEDAATQMARERFQEGVEFFDMKQFDRARAAFLQAYALKRHPAVLLNLAQSELRSGFEADAAKHFAQYLREQKDSPGAEIETAEKGLGSAKAHAAEVQLSVAEDGASISVEGVTEGLSPLPGPIYLKPGTRTITARKGPREGSLQITAVAGQSTSGTIQLRDPGSDVLESKPTSTQPSPPNAESSVLGKGTAELEFPEPGREPFFDWARRSPVAWVMGGVVGGLGLIGGGTFWIVSRQHYSDADSIASQIRTEAVKEGDSPRGICRTPSAHYAAACSLYTKTVDKGDDYRTASWASLGISAFALTGTVVYYFATTGGESAPQSALGLAPRISPWIARDAQGISIAGAF